MPFYIEPYHNPEAATLASLIGGPQRAQAAGVLAAGQAIAAGAQQVGAQGEATLNNLVKLKLDEPRRQMMDIELKQAKQTQADDQAARDAFTQAGGDPDQAVSILEQNGNYVPAMKIRTQLQQQRVQGLDVLDKQLKVNEGRLTQASQLLQGVKTAKDPATAYANVLPQVRSLVGEQLGSKLPDQYDENTVNTALTWGMKATDVLRMQRDSSTIALNGLRTAVTNVELGDKLTKSVATAALTAQSQDDWDKIRATTAQYGDVAKQVLTKFPDQFSPQLAQTAQTLLKPVDQPTKYQQATIVGKVNGKPTIMLAGFDPERNAYYAPGDTEHPIEGARPIPPADQQNASDRAELVKAVQENPALWNDLTDSVKSGLLPDLHRAGGFTPPPKADRGASIATAERWRQTQLKKVDDDVNNGLLTDDQATARKADIEQSFKVQTGQTGAPAPAPKPAPTPAPKPPAPAPKPKGKQGAASNDVQQLLKDQPSGKKYTLSDGSVWLKNADGTVTPATQP